MDFFQIVLTLVVLLVACGFLLWKGVRVVPEYERLVVFRLGRLLDRPLGPGVVFVIPLLDRVFRVDLREKFRPVLAQECITKDNAKIEVSFLYYWKVVNPTWTYTQVQDLEAALEGIATGSLRSVIGLFPLDDALAQRERINEELKDKLEEDSQQWGVTVTRLEIREITPPKDIEAAMHRQLAAEREKRALILEAQGARQSSIDRAEGEVRALELLDKTAREVDQKTLHLKYLDALADLGKGQSTKYIFPLEFTQLVKPFVQAMPVSAEQLMELLGTLVDTTSKGKANESEKGQSSGTTSSPLGARIIGDSGDQVASL